MKDRLNITFLGTGTSQGIPIIGSTHPVCLSKDPKDKRLRVSVMVTWDSYCYVIDCGPDFRQQMLTHNVDKLDGILFTHEHADHTAGIDDIRPFFFKQGDIPIYAHHRVIKALKKRFDYIFTTTNKYPGAPAVDIHEIRNNESFLIGNENAVPIEVYHGTLPVFGFRLRDFVYLTDVKTVPEEEIKKMKDVKVLVINALRIEEHQTHFNLEEALAFIKKINPEKAYLTHISHMLGFHEEVEEKLPENVHLAYDNLKLTV